MMRRIGLGLIVLAIATACGRRNAPPPTEPAVLFDPEAIPGDFILRQRVQGTYGEREVTFDAVVQRQGNSLMVLTLTPYGSRAFAIEQIGQEVSVQTFIGRDLPFDPRFVLSDVQRVFLVNLPDPPRRDGWYRHERGDEIVRERWEAGRLHERRYVRRDRRSKGAIIVRYEGGYVPGQRPPPIELINEWFGYRIVLKTSDYQRL